MFAESMLIFRQDVICLKMTDVTSTGVAPLRREGILRSDTATKANILTGIRNITYFNNHLQCIHQTRENTKPMTRGTDNTVISESRQRKGFKVSSCIPDLYLFKPSIGVGVALYQMLWKD
jgi:hypothetical protein